MGSIKAWLAALATMGLAHTALAVEMPPEDAFVQECALGALEEGTLALDAAGTIWLMEGPWVVAHVATGEQLWPERTRIRCEGTVASITSQGQGTLVVTMLELDFQDFLPSPAAIEREVQTDEAATSVASR